MLSPWDAFSTIRKAFSRAFQRAKEQLKETTYGLPQPVGMDSGITGVMTFRRLPGLKFGMQIALDEGMSEQVSDCQGDKGLRCQRGN